MTQIIGQRFRFGHLLDDLIQNDGFATTSWNVLDAGIPPPLDPGLPGPFKPVAEPTPAGTGTVTKTGSVVPDINVGIPVVTATSAAGVLPGGTVVTNSTTFTNGTATATSASDLNALITAADSQTTGGILTIDISGSIALNTLGTVANGQSLSWSGSHASIVDLTAVPDIAAVNLHSGVSLVINGSNNAILDGGNTVRGLFAYAGSLTVDNLTIQNTEALGGAGGNSAFAGGGGAGLGGGLFVATGANVTLNSVSFSGNKAFGGAGGDNTGGSPVGGWAGGGGLGGNGGITDGGLYMAGGGGVGRTAFGGDGDYKSVTNYSKTDDRSLPGAGIIVGGASGGHGAGFSYSVGGASVANSPHTAGGINGGGGGIAEGLNGSGPPFFGSGAGGGGVGGHAGYSRAFGYDLKNTAGGGGVGGFGGGGGGGYYYGANGGFGGGGGAGQYKYGGNGGFGGGGGGLPDTKTGSSGKGKYALGGFGAGNAGGGYNIGNYGTLNDGAPATTYQLDGGDSGGGGLGAGGAVFVQSGGVLTLGGAGTVNAGTVVGGAAGVPTFEGVTITSKTQVINGTNENGFNTNGTAGSAFGSGIFIQNNSTSAAQGVTLAPGSGQTLSVSGVIADEAGSGGTLANATAGKLVIDGGGDVRLTGSNTFEGGSSISANSTLDLGGTHAAGSGAITFGTGNDGLIIESAAQPNGTAFTNNVSGFVAGDLIDLSGLTFHAGATAHIVSNTLTVISNGVTDTVAVPGASGSLNLAAVQDTGTGTMVEVHNPPTVTTGGTVTFDGGGSPVVADAGASISDPSSTTLVSASVAIGGFISGDTLTVGTAGGLGTVFSSGTLTLTGTASLATYQTALDSVKYGFTSNGDPTGGGSHTSRTLSWAVNDGTASSNTGTSTVDTVHVAPTVVAGATATFDGGGAAVALDSGLLVSDVDSNGVLASATVAVLSPLAGDTLNFTNTNATTEGNVAVASDSGGVLVLTSSGTTATLAQWQTALAAVTYSFSPSNGDPTNGGGDTSRAIHWSVGDGVANSGTVTSTVDTVHISPTVTAGATVSYVSGGAAAVLDSSLTVSDPDSGGNLTGATVTIGAGYASGDTLNFTNQNGITESGFNNGTLTLTGTASILNYESALASISYSFSGADSTIGGGDTSRAIVWSAKDGAGTSGTATSTVKVDTAPKVTSIDTVGSSSNSGGTEQFTVAFSESVTGVATSAFTLADTGSVSGTISSVSGSGSSYTVTVTGATGSGTMGLDLKSSGTGIQDAAGTPISGGFTSGQTFTITPASGAPSISAPSTATVGVNKVGSLGTITIAESPITGGETFTMVLSDGNGQLSANTGAIGGGGTITASNGNKTLTISSATLAQVNADLTTLTDDDPTATGGSPETLSLSLSDSNGGTANAASIAVTVNGRPTISAPASATVPRNTASTVGTITIGETGNTTTSGETFSVVISDGAGILAANTSVTNGGGTVTASNGGKTQTIAGTLIQVNADLTTLTDDDASTASDTISVHASDSFGNSDVSDGSIPVTVTASVATFDAHVYLDANGDGAQDNGETGLGGVTVNLLDGKGNPTGQSSTTNASGNVSFTGLAPGGYEISVVTPSGDAVSQATNTLTPNTLSGGQTASATEGVYAPPALMQATLDLTVAQGMSLGNLWSELIANGVDPKPASLSITAVGTSGTQGSVILNPGTDSLIYIATGLNPSAPVDAFTYTLEDGSGGMVTGTLDVTVTGPNLPTTVATTPGSTATATGSGQRLISEGSGQTLVGSTSGGDELFGGPDTTIRGYGNGNTIYVEPGNHVIAMGANGNTATLNDGNDVVSATGTGNTVTGGNGNDTITGMQGSATITLGNGNDTITISGAGNSVTVGGGKDNINVGTGGDETVMAGGGTDSVTAGGTNDSITLGNGIGDKVTSTGADATIVVGNGGATVGATGAGDKITTGSGNDTILVTAGSATIKAGLGINTIRFAGSGNDIINQGGTDSLTDTATDNTIAVPLAGQGLDSITGSVLANGDTFDLRNALAGTTWDQQLSDLGDYLSLGTSGSNTLVQLSVTSGGTPITVAVLNGQGAVTLSSFVAHALLTERIMERYMSHKIIAAACALLLGTGAARATMVDGSFSGTMNAGSIDASGVFGTPGTDLGGDPVTGTFVYNTNLLSQVLAGGAKTATGTGLGAVTANVMINGVTVTFTDNTSSSVYLDENASELTIQNANSTGGKADNFYLDVSDLFNPFVFSTDLTQPLSTTNPFSSDGSFEISEPGKDAGGSFTLGTLTTRVSTTPEPASLAVLAIGLAGIAGARARRRRAA